MDVGTKIDNIFLQYVYYQITYAGRGALAHRLSRYLIKKQKQKQKQNKKKTTHC